MFNPRQYGTPQASAIAKRVHREDLQPNEFANNRRQTLPPKIAPTMPISMRRGDRHGRTGDPAARGIPGHLGNSSPYVDERSRLSRVRASSSSSSLFKAPSSRNPTAEPKAGHRGTIHSLPQRLLTHPFLTNPQFTLPVNTSGGSSSVSRNPHPPKRRKVDDSFSAFVHAQEPVLPGPSQDGFVGNPPRLDNATKVFTPLPVSLPCQGTSTPVPRFEEREQEDGALASMALGSAAGRKCLDHSTPVSRKPSTLHRQDHATSTPDQTARRVVPPPHIRLRQEEVGGRSPVVNPSTTFVQPHNLSTESVARKDALDNTSVKQQQPTKPSVSPAMGATTFLKDETGVGPLPPPDPPLPPKTRSCKPRFISTAQVKTGGSSTQYVATDSVVPTKDARTSPVSTPLPPKHCPPKPSRVNNIPPNTTKIESINPPSPSQPIKLPPQPGASYVRVRSHVARQKRPDAPPTVRPHNMYQPPVKWFSAKGAPIPPHALRPISKPTQTPQDKGSSSAPPLKPTVHHPLPTPAIHTKEKRLCDLPASPLLPLPPKPPLPVQPAALPTVRIKKEELIDDLPVSVHVSSLPRPPQPIQYANIAVMATPKVEDANLDSLPSLSTKPITPSQLPSTDVKVIPGDTPKLIKRELPDSAEVIIPQRRLVTESCSFYPIPDNCRKSVPGYKDNRVAFFRREYKRLQSFRLTKQKVIFRDDGLAIEWISPVPVWSDTLLPATGSPGSESNNG